jgi:hypothetical protein
LKRFAQVESFVYVGNSNADDVAILKISDRDAKHWKAAGKRAMPVPEAKPTDTDPNPPPLSFDIHIWAFDPFEPSHPQLAERYPGEPGMIFQPRTCHMTRTKPKVVGAKLPQNGGPIEHTVIRSDKASSALHFFVDSCNRMPVHGNSGSLVTVAGRFEDKIGVYHWGIGTRDGKDKFDYLEYTGTDGRTRFLHDILDWQEIFGVGYLFEHFGTAHPNVVF